MIGTQIITRINAGRGAEEASLLIGDQEVETVERTETKGSRSSRPVGMGRCATSSRATRSRDTSLRSSASRRTIVAPYLHVADGRGQGSCLTRSGSSRHLGEAERLAPPALAGWDNIDV